MVWSLAFQFPYFKQITIRYTHNLYKTLPWNERNWGRSHLSSSHGRHCL